MGLGFNPEHCQRHLCFDQSKQPKNHKKQKKTEIFTNTKCWSRVGGSLLCKILSLTATVFFSFMEMLRYYLLLPFLINYTSQLQFTDLQCCLINPTLCVRACACVGQPAMYLLLALLHQTWCHVLLLVPQIKIPETTLSPDSFSLIQSV